MPVKYVDLARQYEGILPEVVKAVEQVLKSGNFILGPQVKKLEEDFARYCNAKYAVGVANGTDALILAMKALGIGAGDEVIVPPNSFLASASSVVLVGAKPVFVDVCEDFNINPTLIEKAITKKTKAIMPVHLTGRPCDMDSIMDIAKKHGIQVIEDCAQAVGAEYRKRKVGSFGIAGCFSFHPLKNLAAAGDGGIITTSDEKVYKRLLTARNHGLKSRDECEFWSINSRLDEIQAAILNVKMKHIDRWNDMRRKNAEYYINCLSGLVEVPREKPFERSVYHTFIVKTDRRGEMKAFLEDKGIETKIHYPIPIHLQQAAKSLGYNEESFPETARQRDTMLSLPIYSEMSRDMQDEVIAGIKEFKSNKK